MKQQKEFIRGANPYMPLWEHVPDGEPRVFTCNGETRVYVYGSHDTERTQYCGKDYVAWSAPVEDMTAWTCHGVCYRAEDDSILYAPDVVQKGDTYYMYAAERKGSVIRVAKSDKPWGPFTDPVKTELGFDPGILVDDDGRVYAYWGFCKAYCAELNDDMATIKPGTIRENPIPHCRAPWSPEDGGFGKDAFFEASSPRKIFGKYVYIYSRRVNEPVPELGVYEDCNGFLSYKWSDRPLDGFRWGGDISFNGGEIIPGPDGNGVMTYRWGNNHGSVMQVNGQWYVFYHRQTGRDEYSRQAMVEPIDAAQGKDGAVYLGKIEYRDGEPVSSRPVEMTSQGAQVNGLDARKWISAGYACHLHGGAGKAYIAPVYEQRDDVSAPVKEMTGGTVAGFRYLRFGEESPETVTVKTDAQAPFTVRVLIDAYNGAEIARMEIPAGAAETTGKLAVRVTGIHAVYFVFDGAEGMAEFDRFTFD
ncbi:MAG: family 43 glycosylhydrolase [Clostridiales bacterium]|nr:family 43 glycosylhydrolase [Clostridiales bacterium]